MYSMGNGRSLDVFRAIHEKQRLIDAGEPSDHIRILYVQSGGLMRGVNGAGINQAFLDRGYHNVFDCIVAASVGAVNSSYFLTGQSGAESIYFEECCEHAFVSWWSALLDLDYICDVFQGATGKGIDTDKLLVHQTRLMILTTDFATGKPHYHVPNTDYAFWKVLRASMTVSALCPQPIMVDGRQQVDGGYADPCPIAWAVREVRPTHVLVMMNYPFDGHNSIPLYESIPLKWLPHIRNRHTQKLLSIALNRARRLERSVRLALRCKRMPIAMVWADAEPGPFCRQPEKLKTCFQGARDFMHGCLNQVSTSIS